MIKIIETCPITKILDCYFNIEKDIIWTDYNGKKQTGLQFKENEDPWASAVGTSNGDELAYTNLNPFFKDTIFEDLINKMGKDYFSNKTTAFITQYMDKKIDDINFNDQSLLSISSLSKFINSYYNL